MIQQQRRLIVEFTKMSGAGNDFIVIDNRFYNFSGDELSKLVIRLSDRHFGIGADGLLALEIPDDSGVDYRMVYYNSDGSRGTMCGNGARCLGRFARMAGVGGESMIFRADAGQFEIVVPENQDQSVRLFFPKYDDFRPAVALQTEYFGGKIDADYIWTGTEHLVCWVDDVQDIDVNTVGRRLRSNTGLGPAGANINFARVQSPKSVPGADAPVIEVRTFEKGVESETMACGTGAIAVSISAIKRGIVSTNPVVIEMPGGILSVGHEGPIDHPIRLTLDGPAEVIFRGTVEI